MFLLLKNLVRNKKVIGYTGKDSFLAKSFIKKYSENFVFRKYKKDINDLNSFKKWIHNNKDIIEACIPLGIGMPYGFSVASFVIKFKE